MPTVLSVAYPLAPVAPDATGGAEQVLSVLEAGLVRRGWRSVVIACEGSRVAGTLVEIARPRGVLDEAAVSSARQRAASVVRAALRALRIDMVHMHGVDFHAYLPPPGLPVLATLHCPPEWHGAEALSPARPDTWLAAVSHHQASLLAPDPRLLGVVENGVPLDRLRPAACWRRGFALMLGRMAPEKGIHAALDAARKAGMAMLVAGELFPYPDHRRYFEREIVPRLDRHRRWIGPVGLARKRRLLAAARCLVVASEVAETSSLSAREAAACGTPVVALDRGALSETVRHGETGLLVARPDELGNALIAVDAIEPARCRAEAEARFSAERMIDGYVAIYRRLLDRRPVGTAGAPAGAAESRP